MNAENIKAKPLKDIGQKERKTSKNMQKSNRTTRKPPPSHLGPDTIGETIHVVELIDDSYMMPEQSAEKLHDLHRDVSSFIKRQDGAVDKISKFLENQHEIQQRQGNIQESIVSHMDQYGKAIQTLLEKQSHYDKIIPHLDRKTTLIDRRVNSVVDEVDSVKNTIDSVKNTVNSVKNTVDGYSKKVDQFLKGQMKAFNPEGRPVRRMAKCKFCSKEMLKASLYCHLRRKTCAVLRSTDDGEETRNQEVKKRARGKRIPCRKRSGRKRRSDVLHSC